MCNKNEHIKNELSFWGKCTLITTLNLIFFKSNSVMSGRRNKRNLSAYWHVGNGIVIVDHSHRRNIYTESKANSRGFCLGGKIECRTGNVWSISYYRVLQYTKSRIQREITFFIYLLFHICWIQIWNNKIPYPGKCSGSIRIHNIAFWNLQRMICNFLTH